MQLAKLGEATVPSPIRRATRDSLFIAEHVVREDGGPQDDGLRFE